MQRLSARSLVAAAVLGCAVVALLALLVSDASKQTVLMDYNYPAQYAVMQEVPVGLAPAFQVPAFQQLARAMYYQCQGMCRELAAACYSKPAYSDDCPGLQTQCAMGCQSGNLDNKMLCFQAAKTNYETCTKNTTPEGISHCKFLFINGVQSC